MKCINKYIKENLFKTKIKGKNVLYHSTGILGFESILRTDYLKGDTWNYRIPNNSKLLSKISNNNISDDEYKKLINDKLKYKLEGISLTRDWFLNYNGAVTFILDKDKLKEKYGRKLQPIDYFGNNNNFTELDGFNYSETNPQIYIKHLGKSNPQRPKGSVESEEFLNINKLVNLHKYIIGFILTLNDYNVTIKDTVIKIEDYCKKYKLNNIPIYDIDGNEIYFDGNRKIIITK